MHKTLNNVLVKPAGPDCNMACSYCFYSSRESLFKGTKAHRMNQKVLEELIRQFMQQSTSEVSITWQGGEPTLMGLDFFALAIKLEERFGKGKTIGNGIQTNGLLIDMKWAQLFKRYSFLLGLSIDGPEHVHDRYRLRRSGQATWRRVNDAARLMLDAGVSVNALSVVNDYSVKFPEEIYSFLRDAGLTYMQFIPCMELDPENPGRIAQYSVSPEAYGEFLCRTFDLWLGDFRGGIPTTSIRFFESLLFSYAGFPPPECTLLPECGNYVVIEHNGDVYACDFFVENEYKLGNIMRSRIDEMLNSKRQLAFGKEKSSLHEDCLGCEWLKLCMGGCTRYRFPVRTSRSYFCPSFKLFFPYSREVFMELAANFRQS